MSLASTSVALASASVALASASVALASASVSLASASVAVAAVVYRRPPPAKVVFVCIDIDGQESHSGIRASEIGYTVFRPLMKIVSGSFFFTSNLPQQRSYASYRLHGLPYSFTEKEVLTSGATGTCFPAGVENEIRAIRAIEALWICQGATIVWLFKGGQCEVALFRAAGISPANVYDLESSGCPKIDVLGCELPQCGMHQPVYPKTGGSRKHPIFSKVAVASNHCPRGETASFMKWAIDNNALFPKFGYLLK